MVLNPKGRHYAALKAHMSQTYEDCYFGQDAIYMERNSRDFRRRTKIVDDNTLAVCEMLRGATDIVREVYYPKFTTSEHYARCAVPGAGHGGLFSVTFATDSASKAFFDALPFPKGPSLGTNFTLACPYAILAHYLELDWVAGYGVAAGLVRVSVGMEERATLLGGFETALQAARDSV